jgi:hypothetical protein
MATLTLAQLRTRVLGRAQMDADDPGAQFVDEHINGGIKYLRSILLEHRPAGFYLEPTASPFTTIQGDHFVSLPQTLETLEGVDVQIGGVWYPAIEFNFADRHKYGQNRPWTVQDDGRVSALYTIAGEKLFFQDPPDAEYSGRIWYTAIHADLAANEDPAQLWTYEDIVIDYAAQLCLEDDELDATHLEKSVAKWEAKIRRKARRRDRSGHAAVRDVTGATLNLRVVDRGQVP